MNRRIKRQLGMKEIAVFSFVITLVKSKFYLISVENNHTDTDYFPNSNSDYTDSDFDVLAHENHDYQDCPLPFNPCPSGIKCCNKIFDVPCFYKV